MPRKLLLDAAGALRPSYAQVDWSATPVGPMSSWSPTLRNVVDLLLQTRFPVTLFWGREFVLIYNEAYVELIADKHPRALGAPAREVFPEAWATIGPLMEGVLAGEGATWVEDAPVPLRRHGFLEEAYFTFSYSPVRNADGAIEGVMDIAAETTRQVVDRRRLATLGRLRELLSTVERADELRDRALAVLRANPDDLPAVELHLPGESGAGGALVAGLGDTGAGRVARLPLGSAPAPARQGVLLVGGGERLAAADDAHLSFLRLIASAIGEALDRVNARDAERAVAAAERTLSEALQRSLLSEPLQPDHLEVAVRYLAAAEQAQVGGDWYDAFLGPDGSLMLAIGDVTGHDRWAAAAMAQVRNLLRGVSYTMHGSPGHVLSGLDLAMRGLAVGVYATAVLARVEHDKADAERGVRTMRWSNAGHLPPVLITPDGRPRLLETPPDPLLGIGAGRRADHVVTLEPGALVVFYTDGLIERRGISVQRRLESLIRVLDDGEVRSADELCDRLLGQLESTSEDDIALLVLRACPDDGTRPSAAGLPEFPLDRSPDRR